MNVLVTGGAGYIGAHLVRALAAAGHNCLVFDNLSAGRREAVGRTPLVAADVTDLAAISSAMRDHKTEAVVHLAAFIEAGESVERPGKYFHNNTFGGLTLLRAMRDVGVGKMVFSSTAAVYGIPESTECTEDSPLSPINPYGTSKLMSEMMLRDLGLASEMRHVILRYFNVAGSDPAGRIGQSTRNATLLIKVAAEVAVGLAILLNLLKTRETIDLEDIQILRW